jgi:hypothetical protein
VYEAPFASGRLAQYLSTCNLYRYNLKEIKPIKSTITGNLQNEKPLACRPRNPHARITLNKENRTKPGLAQSYSASYGTGNVIDLPSLEKTNGRYGYGGSVAPRSGDSQSAYAFEGGRGTSAYAYSPKSGMRSGNRDRRHSR